jgi:dihydroxy-acid dehydratase
MTSHGPGGFTARWPNLFCRLLAAPFSMTLSIEDMSKKASKRPPADREYSSIVLDGYERAGSRAMLYATGFTKEDFKKSQVGVASTWSMVTPCNMHIDQLAVHVAQGVNEAGGKAVVFGTITISDAVSMGTEGMKYSLVSREVIADSIETVAGCEGFDGLVAIGGCDKNMPGCVMVESTLSVRLWGHDHAGKF